VWLSVPHGAGAEDEITWVPVTRALGLLADHERLSLVEVADDGVGWFGSYKYAGETGGLYQDLVLYRFNAVTRGSVDLIESRRQAVELHYESVLGLAYPSEWRHYWDINGEVVWVGPDRFNGSNWERRIEVAPDRVRLGPVADRDGWRWFVVQQPGEPSESRDDTYALLGVSVDGRRIEHYLYSWFPLDPMRSASLGYWEVDLLKTADGEVWLVMPDYLMCASCVGRGGAPTESEYPSGFEATDSELSPRGNLSLLGSLTDGFAVIERQEDAWRVVLQESQYRDHLRPLCFAWNNQSVDNQDSIWVAGGLGAELHQDGGWGTRYTAADYGLSQSRILDITVAPGGGIWLAGATGGAVGFPAAVRTPVATETPSDAPLWRIYLPALVVV
jgi:hypothetical protein